MTSRRVLALFATAAVVVAIVIAVTSATTTSAAPRDPLAAASGEPPAEFDIAERTSPLDIFGARFGQTASGEVALTLRTYEPWEPKLIIPTPVNGLCVWLRTDASPTPGGRLCVVPNAKAKSGVSLRYTALDHKGNRIGIRNMTSEVRRPQPTIVTTRFWPATLRLVPGEYHWYVRSVAVGVEDRLPDSGELPLRIAVSTAPAASARCFGAASRDQRRKCTNHRLRHEVVPTPDEAVVSQNSPCTPIEVDNLVSPCEFGVPTADASAKIALVGDSHASHWRSALEYVAQRERWSGVSITRSGCPLSRASPALQPESRRRECQRWNRQVPKWFARHPEVHTIFVVAHAAAAVSNRNDRDEGAAKVDGFIDAWKSLPSSIRRIVVIRDTPLIGFDAFECVERAHKHNRNAGSACSVARGKAMRGDSAVVAAHRLHARRVRVIDMTRYFCSPRRCYPVVGGALVYKDDQHMTEVFGSTLGPFLQRAIAGL